MVLAAEEFYVEVASETSACFKYQAKLFGKSTKWAFYCNSCHRYIMIYWDSPPDQNTREDNPWAGDCFKLHIIVSVSVWQVGRCARKMRPGLKGNFSSLF